MKSQMNLNYRRKDFRRFQMKKTFHILIVFGTIFAACLLSSCMSMGILFDTPNYYAAEKVHAPDVTTYSDYAVEKCKLPDGKTATVYVFDNVGDQIKWQNVQQHKFNPEHQKEAKQIIAERESEGRDASYWKWNPTGPLTPFWKAYYALVKEQGKETAEKNTINVMSPLSYYNAEDLGQLAPYMKTDISAAQACYEDSTGVYLLTIAKPKFMSEKIISNDMKKQHKDEFVYQIAFIPKEWYKVPSVKLNPAKTQPYNPSAIPDSNKNLAPVIPSGNGIYYYDENLSYRLQWLAVIIACKGMYDMAYTGDFRAKNPTDYYKTGFIKSYLANNDGKASKGTTLFEGICFDYADFAYQELKNNKKEYPNVANFWMVGTFQDSSDIVAYKLAESGESPTMTINRTPVVVFSHNHIFAHDSAKNHAWFWVQSTDGTVYWVDPTWTDNSGCPVYGIVRGGKEIQLEPDSRLFAR